MIRKMRLLPFESEEKTFARDNYERKIQNVLNNFNQSNDVKIRMLNDLAAKRRRVMTEIKNKEDKKEEEKKWVQNKLKRMLVK